LKPHTHNVVMPLSSLKLLETTDLQFASLY
jgi:hypothetical protein